MALDFAAGCLGGCAGIIVGHPFDTVKVHLQTQDFRNPVYRGTFHCLKTVIVNDSIRGLYRGLSSPMAGVAFVNAIVFGVYGNIQRRMENPNSLKSHFIAGSLAGLAQSIVCSPMELAKTRLQLQSNNRSLYKGPIDCLAQIHSQHGIRGLFKGLGITAIRDVPGFSSYFVAYELMTRNSTPSTLHTLMAGGLAGTFSWLVTFPVDILKSRLQADGMTGSPKYNGAIDCLRQSYKEEGAVFLSRGLTSTLLRAFPMNAACFLVVSWVLKFCEQTNVSIEICQPDKLHVIKSQPFFSPARYHSDSSKTYRLNHNVKSLIFLGAFSEAVCASEIIDMANDGLLVNENEYYYHTNLSSTERLVLYDE